MAKPKAMRYTLEVEDPRASTAWPPPNTDYEPLLRLRSPYPFPPFQVGDELVLRNFDLPEGKRRALHQLVLRVAKVRHCVAEGDGMIDAILTVFTEEVRRPRAVVRQGNPERN